MNSEDRFKLYDWLDNQNGILDLEVYHLIHQTTFSNLSRDLKKCLNMC